MPCSDRRRHHTQQPTDGAAPVAAAVKQANLSLGESQGCFDQQHNGHPYRSGSCPLSSTSHASRHLYVLETQAAIARPAGLIIQHL
jgi:hypothetical protein